MESFKLVGYLCAHIYIYAYIYMQTHTHVRVYIYADIYKVWDFFVLAAVLLHDSK